jgi:plastocyanin
MSSALGGCGLPGAANEHERQVLVDYHFDQYAAVFPAYFPKQVRVHPGDTVVFKQSWSGEPHTVTMGTTVDEVFNVMWKYIKDAPPFPDTSQPPPADVVPVLQSLNSLPPAQSQTSNQFVQQGAQPCYVASGKLPDPGPKPCPDRTLKPFNGRQVYYNSGIIPYQGEQGNTYRLGIAADATPGTHYYMCLIHGPFMSGAVTIVPNSQAIPSQADVNADAQRQLSKLSDPFGKALKDAQGRGGADGNLAGVAVPPTIQGSLTEFVPRTIKVKARQKITWRIVGDFHTVSFDVPKYFPEIKFAKDGAVTYSDETVNPVAGPGFPPPPPFDPTSTGPPPAPQPVHVDAGNYDGSHFLSSGLGGPTDPSQEVTYSVTFTKPGTYKYACLVHPQMVGEVDVQ